MLVGLVHAEYRCRSDPSTVPTPDAQMAVETKMAPEPDKASINDIDVKDKRVLMRVDFNVPQDKKTGRSSTTSASSRRSRPSSHAQGREGRAPRRTCSRRALICRSFARPPCSGPQYPRLGSHSDVAPGSPRWQAQPIDDAQAGRRAVRRANPNQHTVGAAVWCGTSTSAPSAPPHLSCARVLAGWASS